MNLQYLTFTDLLLFLFYITGNHPCKFVFWTVHCLIHWWKNSMGNIFVSCSPNICIYNTINIYYTIVYSHQPYLQSRKGLQSVPGRCELAVNDVHGALTALCQLVYSHRIRLYFARVHMCVFAWNPGCSAVAFYTRWPLNATLLACPASA